MIKEMPIDEFSKKYLCLIDGKEIGFIEIKKLYEVLDIINLFIEEDYRKKGYAQKLLNYVIEKNKDVEKIMLEVKEDNVPAINLYKKLGFKKISERKNYYKNKTAYIMERVI